MEPTKPPGSSPLLRDSVSISPSLTFQERHTQHILILQGELEPPKSVLNMAASRRMTGKLQRISVPVTRGRHISTCHSHIVYRSHCLTTLTSTCSAIRVSNIHISTCYSHIVYRSHCLTTLTSTCSAIKVSNIHISTCHSHC